MKRYLSVVLALFLAFTALPALAAPGDALLFPQDPDDDRGGWAYQCSLAVVGDTLYILKRDERLDCWKAGEADSTQLMDVQKFFMDGASTEEPADETIAELPAGDSHRQRSARTANTLIGGGDALYAIDANNQSLWKYLDQEKKFEKVVDLQQDGLTYSWDATEAYPVGITSAWIVDGALYLAPEDYESDSGKLYQFDLSTGKSTEIKVDQLTAFAPYRSGQLLVAQGEYRGYERIGVLEISTGQVEKKLELNDSFRHNVSGLQYDPETDAFYLVMPGGVMKSTGFAPLERTAYLPLSDSYQMVTALMPGGLLAVTQDTGLSVRNTDPQYMPDRALRFSEHSAWDDAVRAFSAARPEIPLDFSGGYAHTAEEFTKMLSDGTAPDVFSLDATYVDIETLAQKGYLYDLSGDAVIAEAVKKYYLDVQEALTVNGGLIGVPSSYYAGGWGYSPKGFEAVGLTEQDVPKTFAEMLSLIDRWEVELAGQYPSMELFEGGDVSYLKENMIGQIITIQALHCSVNNQPLTFDTPVLRQLFQQMERTRFGNITEEQRMQGFSWSDDGETPIALFSNYYSPIIERYGRSNASNWQLLKLSLDEQTPPYLSANMSIYCVNPHSDNLDAALEFMRYLATDMPDWLLVNLSPDFNEPIENPSYPRYYSDYEKTLKNLEDQIAQTTDEDAKKMLQTELDHYRESELQWIEREHWIASAEDIQQYREVRELLKFNKSLSMFQMLGEDFYMLYQRFTDGQMKSDQFLTELSQKLRMAQMEG